MWSFIEPINLIRYLCVWRVNRALVRRPNYLAAELSQVLGTIIAGSLPTRQARVWQKAMNENSPAWPVESVLFVYPGKRFYGPGEPILWELKLLDPEADHAFFLEIILPAMEAAGRATDSRWYQSNTLWGRFDIEAVYVARGAQWEPLVSNGRLNTGYQAIPTQWAEGLSFTPTSQDKRAFNTFTWLTPVDLRPPPALSGSLNFPAAEPEPEPDNAKIPTPTLQFVLEALLSRVAHLTPGKYTTPGDVWNSLPPDEQSALWEAVIKADQIDLRDAQPQTLPKNWPQGWLGKQSFEGMADLLLPYLELASILHIGRRTHIGCGTFVL